jgi:hypothetical protein
MKAEKAMILWFNGLTILLKRDVERRLDGISSKSSEHIKVVSIIILDMRLFT